MTDTAYRQRPAPRPPGEAGHKQLAQYSLARILGAWAAAALPMAALAWVVAPWLADAFEGPSAWPRAIVVSLTARPGLAVHPRAGSRPPRAGLAALVRGEGRAVVASPAEPANRASGRTALAAHDSPRLPGDAKEEVPKLHPPAGTWPSSWTRRRARRSSRGTGPGSWDRRDDGLQHGARRGAALPWPAPPADAGRLRSVGLGGQRRPVRDLPPARSVGHPADDARRFVLAYPSRRYRSAVMGIIVHSRRPSCSALSSWPRPGLTQGRRSRRVTSVATPSPMSHGAHSSVASPTTCQAIPSYRYAVRRRPCSAAVLIASGSWTNVRNGVRRSRNNRFSVAKTARLTMLAGG